MTPAETFPLNVYLLEEMLVRGWDYDELSHRSSITVDRLRGILAGDRVSEEECKALGEAYEVPWVMFWAIQQRSGA